MLVLDVMVSRWAVADSSGIGAHDPMDLCEANAGALRRAIAEGIELLCDLSQ